MKVIIKLALLLLGLNPLSARADFSLICRGANIPGISKEIKSDVEAKLKAASISFKNVKVSFIKITRPTGTFTTSYLDNLSLSSGSNPTVSFSGAFASPEACNVTAKLRIKVHYGEGVISSSVVDVQVPGSLLFKSRLSSDL